MTATVRMRDDFNFRALGEASIAGQALGIDHKTGNWQTGLSDQNFAPLRWREPNATAACPWTRSTGGRS
jgi:hypothetical protein